MPWRSAIGTATTALVVVLVILAGTLGYTSLSLPRTALTTTTTLVTTRDVTQTSTVTIAPALYQPCIAEVWNASFPTPYMQHVPVLLMRPNSTGYVCVTYQTGWQGNQSLYRADSMFNSYPLLVNGSYQFYPFSAVSYKCTTNLLCIQTISNSFRVSVLPDSIRPSASMNYVTVVYVVTALSNSTGFYDESAPWVGCLGMPMAVGYTMSQVNASDFTQPPRAPGCFAQLFIPVAERTTGMNVTYIDWTRQ